MNCQIYVLLAMRVSSLTAFAGFMLIIIGCYCPLLRPFHLFNYTIFSLSKPFGFTVLLVAVIGVLGSALNNAAVLKSAAYAGALLVVVLFVAAIFQVKSTFNFIPFKGIASGLSRQIAFKWGWYILFTGALLATAGALSSKPAVTSPK